MKLGRFVIGFHTACMLTAMAQANGGIPATVDWITEIEKGEIKIGAVVSDPKNRTHLWHRRDERFPMCSTFKLLAAAAVLQRVDRKEENLDRVVRYTQADILEYAPVTKQHVAEGGMKLGALCEAAISQSDNTAGNLLLQTIGGPNGVTQFARSIEDKVTRLDRKEPELNRWTPGDERDTTNPEVMCDDLKLLLDGDLLSQQSRKLLDDWLQHNETGATLVRAGVPSGWRVGDKTGRSGNGATNDVAVIYPPDGAPIFAAIYTFGGSDEQRSAAIASVTRRICEIFRPAH
ncbi:MAG TPA: class A beta-lactamase [Chthoniobacterales bacterium]|nr:class A beta-lactamase [Chthoniobacterales bacterium]